jgi:hypothetical protein
MYSKLGEINFIPHHEATSVREAASPRGKIYWYTLSLLK